MQTARMLHSLYCNMLKSYCVDECAELWGLQSMPHLKGQKLEELVRCMRTNVVRAARASLSNLHVEGDKVKVPNAAFLQT